MLVVVLLNDGSERAGNTNAVAAHDERLLLTVLVHKGGTHGLGILGAQLEDLGDLDAASSGERLAAVRAGIAGHNSDQVGPLVDGKVALGAGTGKVIVDLVGAAGPLLGLTQTLVAHQTNALGQVNRSDKALVQTVRLELLVGHHAIALAKDMLGLAVIELVVARDNGHDRLALGVDKRQRLSRTVLGETEELGDGLDGAHARSLDLGERTVARTLDHNDLGACGLIVGSEAAIVAVDERSLAGVGQSHVLDGGVAADLAGVGDNGQSLDVAALADVGVGLLHLVVLLLQTLLRGREAVGVLHDELATAHQAKAGTELVAELILDVIEVHRQLLVGTQLIAHQGSHGLLVRGSENKLAAVAVIKAHKLLAIGVNATGLTPQLGVDHDRHHKLLGTGGIHLVAHDVLDLANRAPCERQVGIQTGGLLADHAGTEQQAVAVELSVRRILFKRRRIELRHIHCSGHLFLLNKFVDLCHKRVDNLVLSYFTNDLAMRKEQGLTTSASNAQVGIRSLTGAINGTSHHGDGKRRGIVLQSLGNLLGDGNEVDLATSARGTRDDLGTTAAQAQRLQDTPGDRRLLDRIGRERDAHGVTDTLRQQNTKAHRALNGALKLGTRLGYAQVKRNVGNLTRQGSIGIKRRLHAMGLSRKHDVRKAAVFKMLDETLARHHELFGLRKIVALGNILLKRARVHANANRAARGTRGIDDSVNLGPIADIAGVDAQLGGTGLDGADGKLMVKVDIGDDWHRRLGTNRAKAIERSLGRHAHANNIATRLGKRTHLRKRCLGVGGIGAGHGLNHHRRATTDLHAAHIYGARQLARQRMG